jgi:sortase A
MKTQKRINFALTVIAVLLSIVVSGLWLHIAAGSKQAVKPASLPSKSVISQQSDGPKSKAEHSFGVPKKIKIPIIGVEADIVPKGLTAQGDMDVPDSLKDVGWYKLGPKPGAEGSAVVAGHHGVQKGKEGVFWNLNKLTANDLVYVVDEAGVTATFRVKDVKIYGANDHPPDVFSSAAGVHLNLITCTGRWDKATQTFTDRLVVFTDLEL